MDERVEYGDKTAYSTDDLREKSYSSEGIFSWLRRPLFPLFRCKGDRCETKKENVEDERK